MTKETTRLPYTAEGGALADGDRAATELGNHPDIQTLSRELAATLANPAAGPEMLRRQAHLLDAMLMSLMGENFAERMRERYIEDWVEMVLRIQKQCADTVKTLETVTYMKALAAPKALPPTPFSKTVEQKEGFE